MFIIGSAFFLLGAIVGVILRNSRFNDPLHDYRTTLRERFTKKWSLWPKNTKNFICLNILVYVYFKQYLYQQHFLLFFFSFSDYLWIADVRVTDLLLFGLVCSGLFVDEVFLTRPYSLFFFAPAVRVAKSLKNYFTFWPLFADTYMNVNPRLSKWVFAVFVETARSSSRSFLLPMIRIKASSPLTSRTLSIHLDKFW